MDLTNKKNIKYTKALYKKLHISKFYSHRSSLEMINWHWPNRKKIIDKSFKGKKTLKVLHIGSSTAIDTYHFFLNINKNFEFHLVDLNKINNKIQTNLNITFFKTDFLKFSSKIKYDIILCYGVLHHFKDWKKAMNKMNQLTKKKSLIFLQCNTERPLLQNLFFSNLRKIEDKKLKNICYDLTLLGKYLSKIKQKIIIKKNLKSLNISSGVHNLHHLMHYYILRVFYNNKWPVKASIENQLDWYLCSWCHEIDINYIRKITSLNIIQQFSPSPSTNNLVLKKISD